MVGQFATIVSSFEKYTFIMTTKVDISELGWTENAGPNMTDEFAGMDNAALVNDGHGSCVKMSLNF